MTLKTQEKEWVPPTFETLVGYLDKCAGENECRGCPVLEACQHNWDNHVCGEETYTQEKALSIYNIVESKKQRLGIRRDR